MGLGRLLAIDHGTVRIGLALSDPLGIVATPYCILPNEKNDKEFSAICDLVSTESVIKIVIGLPTDSEGKVGTQAQKVIDWAWKLSAYVNQPIVFWDESYSSAEVEELRRSRKTRSSQKTVYIDDIAAAVILKEYLEAGGQDNEPGQALQNFDKSP